MGIEIVITCLLLVGLMFLATVDMAFGQLSDVGLRRLITEAEERPLAVAAFLREIQEDRPRFRFTLGASIQIQLVAVSILITSILLRWFSGLNLLLIALFTGLLLAGIFRQLIPRMISLRNPEKTLLALLPLVKPFYRLLAFVADPLNRRARV